MQLLKCSTIVFMHSKGSVSNRYLSYIGLRGQTSHCTEEHPTTLTLWSKEKDGFGLGIYFECLLRLSQRSLYGGLEMGIKVEECQRDLEMNSRKGDEEARLDLGIYPESGSKH